jgi:hypothetical protein
MWRLLIFDQSDADNPRWLLASITLSTDVRPARMEGSRFDDWPEVT